MSADPTEAIMDALIEHYPMFDINGHINGTVPGQGAWDCWCGRVNTVTREEVFEHAAQAIVGVLTANGWALVRANDLREALNDPNRSPALTYRERRAAIERLCAAVSPTQKAQS